MSMLRRSVAALVPAFVLLAPMASIAGAQAPHYHLTQITIPGASDVFVADINNAGQAVGYYADADFEDQAFLFDGTTVFTLPRPADRMDGFATAINELGQIVGSTQTITDNGTLTTSMLWDAAHPDTYTVIGNDQANKLSPADINDAGIVVGLNSQDGSFRAFTWSAAGGLIDDGVPPEGDATDAYWSAINNGGHIVGGWNFPFSAAHATSGQLGTAGITPLAAWVDDVASMAHGINDADTMVGEMDMDGSGHSVPVIFKDGVATAIPGTLLGLLTGDAYGINEAGVIVGRAQDFGTLEFKAFVFIDGVSWDILAQSDSDAGFPYLLKAVAVNESGIIAGVGRVGDFNVGSFIATPVVDDSIIADGFDG